MCQRIVRCQLQRLPVRFQRRFKSSLFALNDGDLVVRYWVCRIQLNGLAKRFQRGIQLPGIPVSDTKIKIGAGKPGLLVNKLLQNRDGLRVISASHQYQRLIVGAG